MPRTYRSSAGGSESCTDLAVLCSTCVCECERETETKRERAAVGWLSLSGVRAVSAGQAEFFRSEEEGSGAPADNLIVSSTAASIGTTATEIQVYSTLHN